jgi:hypothetical protein
MKHEEWSDGVVEYWSDGSGNPTLHYSITPLRIALKCNEATAHA